MRLAKVASMKKQTTRKVPYDSNQKKGKCQLPKYSKQR